MVGGSGPSACRAFSDRMREKEKAVDLDRLNSATKYPSILTYHGLGERGRLTDEVTEFPDGAVLTEKVDGTNGRIVVMPDGDHFIGQRESLLYAKGDRVPNPSESIVVTLRTLADRLKGDGTKIAVYFLEVYGGKVGSNAKQYSTTGTTGYRLFDVALIDPGTLKYDTAKISAWREGGGQEYLDETSLINTAGIMGIPMAPRLGTVDGSDLPRTIQDTYDFLGQRLPRTQVGLDHHGRSEGIVLRSPDRKVIAKARFQDYERTLKIPK